MYEPDPSLPSSMLALLDSSDQDVGTALLTDQPAESGAKEIWGLLP